MARVAKKKTVDNGLSYEFCIKEKDVTDRLYCGSFEVIKTKSGIMYKNFSGFHVFTTPYAVGPMGEAVETSLFARLNELIGFHKEYEKRMDEQVEEETLSDGTPLTYGDLYTSMKIIIEANLSFPQTALIDMDEASVFANKYIEKLTDAQNKLLEAMNGDVASEEEAVKADAEEGAKALMQDTINEMIDEAEAVIKNAK